MTIHPTDDPPGEPLSLARGAPLGFLSGLVIGAAAGLIGVGGGEFRIPVLLHLLRLPVKAAAAANTVIGLAVVVLGVARRWSTFPADPEVLQTALIMAAVSIPGAALGARQAHHLASPLLRRIVIAYLFIVGIAMIVEALLHAEFALFHPAGPARWLLAALVGFLIAAASGSLGVAGGEMRIPALIYLFALPIKTAGTASLIASIPTVAASALVYRRLGHLPPRVLTLALVMAVGSLLGVLFGAALLPHTDPRTLKALLGALLLAATATLALPAFRSSPPP